MPFEELASCIPELMEQYRVPGVSVAGELAWEEAFGVADVSTGQPVTGQTVFQAASLTKPVFAYAMVKEWEAGRLPLDQPLSDFTSGRYVPDDPRIDQVTARMVLSHTTGLPNWRKKGEPLAFEAAPGARWGYSGEGYVYLSRVIEHITGQELAQFVAGRVLQPLGMSVSSLTWQTSYSENEAGGHDANGNPTEASEFTKANVAASLYSTPTDLAKFMVSVLGPPKHSEALLTQASIPEMLRPQVQVQGDVYWGLGWGLERSDKGFNFWQWGDNGPLKAFAMGSPRTATGVIVMT